MVTTPFERCGGFATVRKIVSTFYDRVLDSPTLQRFFANVDTRLLVDHQTKFIAAVMGGPAAFDDEHLRRAHARLGIVPTDFEEMAALLRETMEDFGVEPADVELVQREIRRRESLIVARPG